MLSYKGQHAHDEDEFAAPHAVSCSASFVALDADASNMALFGHACSRRDAVFQADATAAAVPMRAFGERDNGT